MTCAWKDITTPLPSFPPYSLTGLLRQHQSCVIAASLGALPHTCVTAQFMLTLNAGQHAKLWLVCINSVWFVSGFGQPLFRQHHYPARLLSSWRHHLLLCCFVPFTILRTMTAVVIFSAVVVATSNARKVLGGSHGTWRVPENTSPCSCRHFCCIVWLGYYDNISLVL